ncbi:hypothetical protein GCM10009069_28920 [Algimonas arctica]|uniref:FecR protein domain-containing protein n=1 Tax=Algimonas arctica TaxID=1479486 RepID=A0A8J3G3P7_9PROT|nr:FecR domain-containing protein [Algimonas arctica]GHB04552.1 hypothetical protein GCM10009069_28920 [Algimonas arctica]
MITSLKISSAATVLALLSTFVCTAPSYAQDTVGRNSAIKGSVTIQSVGEDIRSAAVKDDIFLGDDIGSAADSSLQILLLDETVFTVGASAQLTIDEFVYDPSSNGNKMSASIKKGMFRFMSGNISKTDPQNVELNTPVASLGIRGTIVEGFVGPEAVKLAIFLGIIDPSDLTGTDGASIIVLRGPGPRNGGSDAEGVVEVITNKGTVLLDSPGESVFVPGVDVEPKIFELPQAGFAAFSAQIRNEPKGSPPPKPSFSVPAMPPASPPPPPAVDIGVGPSRGGPVGRGGEPIGNEDFDPLIDIDGAIEEPEDEGGCTFIFECSENPDPN